MAVFCVPEVFAARLDVPTAQLPEAVFAPSASRPTATLEVPVTFASRDLLPTAVFEAPVLTSNA